MTIFIINDMGEDAHETVDDWLAAAANSARGLGSSESSNRKLPRYSRSTTPCTLKWEFSLYVLTPFDVSIPTLTPTSKVGLFQLRFSTRLRVDFTNRIMFHPIFSHNFVFEDDAQQRRLLVFSASLVMLQEIYWRTENLHPALKEKAKGMFCWTFEGDARQRVLDFFQIEPNSIPRPAEICRSASKSPSISQPLDDNLSAPTLQNAYSEHQPVQKLLIIESQGIARQGGVLGYFKEDWGASSYQTGQFGRVGWGS